jgi:uncharacterized membrane protein YvbJ
MQDEDPTDEDVDRFSGQNGYCPDCGKEIWDEAWQCPHCGSVVEDRIRREGGNPASSLLSARAVILMVAALIGVLILMQLR